MALSAAAVVTDRLILGTGVALVVQRDPITLAKEAASVDHLSGGRFQLGVGAGWLREEMRNHGTEPRTRLALMRERVLAMKEIWTAGESRISWRIRRFRPDLLMAQAGRAALPAGAGRRQRPHRR